MHQVNFTKQKFSVLIFQDSSGYETVQWSTGWGEKRIESVQIQNGDSD